jgi:hypothetical protein
MIENKSLEVTPDDIWKSVIENPSDDKETQWKGKDFLIKDFSYLFVFLLRHESNRTYQTCFIINWKISWFIIFTLYIRLFT